MRQFWHLIPGTLLSICLLWGPIAQAQLVTEIEPNDPCTQAQVLGDPLALPTIVVGELSSFGDVLDIDFFRFNATPGQLVRIDLEGASTSAGTLGDPLLGLFNADCAQVDANDDGGTGVNSRLSVVTPDDGVIIIAATTYPDFSFVGGGVGTYTLTMSQPVQIEAIGGRVVDANTGAPLPGTDVPYTAVQLLRCENDQCFDFVGFQATDELGNFLFNSNSNGSALDVGTYQITVNAFGYEFYIGEPFETFEGDVVNLGDIGLVPFRIIGSLSGRLVDAFSGGPLSGSAPPFAYVILERCEEFGCYGISSANADEDGRFRFEGAQFGIPPGDYRLRGFAEGYESSASDTYTIGENEDRDIGNFALNPLPIEFLGSTACELPPGGGVCEFSVDIRARALRRYQGAAWSTIDVFGPPTYAVTRFQVGRHGAGVPMPQRVNLRNGQRQTLNFTLDVPAGLAEGTVVCAFVTVGQAPSPQFFNQGTQFVFCAAQQADGIRMLSGKEARKKLRSVRDETHPGGASRRAH